MAFNVLGIELICLLSNSSKSKRSSIMRYLSSWYSIQVTANSFFLTSATPRTRHSWASTTPTSSSKYIKSALGR